MRMLPDRDCSAARISTMPYPARRPDQWVRNMSRSNRLGLDRRRRFLPSRNPTCLVDCGCWFVAVTVLPWPAQTDLRRRRLSKRGAVQGAVR